MTGTFKESAENAAAEETPASQIPEAVTPPPVPVSVSKEDPTKKS